VEEEAITMRNESAETQAMDEDPPMGQEQLGDQTVKSSKTKALKKWESDTTISQLSATFVTILQEEQEKLQEAGEEAVETKYKSPTEAVEIQQQNRIRISIRKVRNAESQPTLKLFKSFVKALRECDPSVVILPINASKQKLPSLSNAAMVNAIDINKLQTYFKSYYPNQKTNLSGYINILTNLDFTDLDIAPPVYEWLESNRYTMKECLSQDEEMVQIGALCFGSEFIYREDLKKAIETDSAWKFPNLEKAPVIQLTRGEFRASKKSKKMIFIHTEKSKQQEVAKVFSEIYDGTSKAYPNGIMLLFIPLHDNVRHDAAYRQKVIYNHEQYLGDEEGITIFGLQDIDMVTTLKNQQHITIRMLLRCLPATQGMSRPQLFQSAETNASRDAIIVTYQKPDRELVQARLLTLQHDITAQLASEEAEKIFISELEGLTFRPITKTRGGQIIHTLPTSQTTINHIQHTKTILSSPPKKRQYAPQNSDQDQINQYNKIQTRSSITRSVSYVAAAQHRQTATAPSPIQHSTQGQNRPTGNIDLIPPPDTSTRHQLDNLSKEMNHRFLLVEEELKGQRKWNTEQREWNEDVILRMNYIEDTTTTTDLKVDSILSKLDSWDIPTKRRVVTSNSTEERSAPYPHLHGNNGDMSK